MNDTELEKLIRPLPQAIYACDYSLDYLEKSFNRLAHDYGGMNLCPDFQRGHVWTEDQQRQFCEALLRHALPQSLLTVQFNCPHWGCAVATDLPREIQCVDGLQRITALQKLLRGEVKPFGLKIDELNNTRFSINYISSYHIRMNMHAFARRADLLQYYLDINGGGTPHTPAELDRIRVLLAEAKHGKLSANSCPGQ